MLDNLDMDNIMKPLLLNYNRVAHFNALSISRVTEENYKTVKSW
jgi:hypothetical protein